MCPEVLRQWAMSPQTYVLEATFALKFNKKTKFPSKLINWRCFDFVFPPSKSVLRVISSFYRRKLSTKRTFDQTAEPPKRGLLEGTNLFESPAHFEEVRQGLSIYICEYVRSLLLLLLFFFFFFPSGGLGMTEPIELKFSLNSLPHPGFKVCFGEVDP